MAITIFITPPFTYQVLPTTAIPAQYQGNQIVLDGCPGEYRSASFTVKPDTDTTINVSATMPGLEIDVRAVKCWWQNKGIGSEPWHVPFTKTLTPELLLKDDDLVRVRGNENYLRLSSGEMWISNPNEGTRWTIPNSERTGLQDTETLQPVSVPAGTNKQFWVTVHIPEGTPAGTYTGQITVNGTVINIILTVYPFKLEIPAVETNIYYSSQFHSTYSTICGPKGELQLRAELRNMRQHGIENYFMEQWSNYVDHAQNISDLQRHLQIRKEEGFTSPNLYYSGPKIYNYFEGSVTMAELVAWVQEVKSIAAPYDFTDVYFYGRDEVEGQDLYDEIPVFDAIHNAGGKIFLTTSDTPVDAPIPSAGNRTLAQIIDLGIRAYGLSSAEAAKWHTQGHRLFNYGNPQGGVEEPMLYRRNYGLKLWQKDYDGGMTYSVNGNMYDPWNDFDHATYKDEMMVYPTVNGCVDTIQWEGFREGINDLRYLNTLLKAIQTSSGDTAPAISYLNSLKAANLDSVDMDTVRSNLIQHLMFLDSAMAKIFIIPGITDTRILPRSVIPAQYEGDTINLRGSPGEFLPVSFVLQTTTSLTNLTVNPSNLVGPATIPASAIDIKIVKVWYQAGVGIRDVSHKQLVPELLLNDDSFIKITNTGENWIKLTNGTYRLISTPADTTTNVYPPVESFPIKDADTLQPINILAGNNQQFWVTVKIPNVAAGLYSGIIVLDSTEGPVATLSLNIEVLPITLLPPNLIYSCSYYSQIGFTSTYPNGTISDRTKSVQQFTAELHDMLDHGIDNPICYQLEEDATFNLLAQYLSIRQSLGMTGKPLYFVGLQQGYPPIPSVQTVLALALSYGFPTVYFYGIDEADDATMLAQRTSWQAVHDAGGKIYAAESSLNTFNLVGDLLDLVRWEGPPNATEATKWHSIGHEICCYGNPQFGVEAPETYRRNYGLLLWQKDYDGEMNYAYMAQFGDIWNDFDYLKQSPGSTQPGFREHNMVYPTMNGIIDTVQWEGFREGVTDIRYLTTLLNTIQVAQGQGKDTSAAETYLNSMKAANLGTRDMDAIRSDLINHILFLEGNMANVFAPGQAKTATVPVTVIPAGLACQIELFLGPNDTTKSATSGKLNFTSTGAVQNLALPIMMPNAGGTYHVYIDIFYQNVMVVAFQATEDVIIITGTIGPPIWT